ASCGDTKFGGAIAGLRPRIFRTKRETTLRSFGRGFFVPRTRSGRVRFDALRGEGLALHSMSEPGA
ncbi:MAG TPA: hypothetical protein VHZ95_01765, partial [Polyangiales bacterium]|nr:hypothetical protein [Polyangiales bacterium]